MRSNYRGDKRRREETKRKKREEKMKKRLNRAVDGTEQPVETAVDPQTTPPEAAA